MRNLTDGERDAREAEEAGWDGGYVDDGAELDDFRAMLDHGEAILMLDELNRRTLDEDDDLPPW